MHNGVSLRLTALALTLVGTAPAAQLFSNLTNSGTYNGAGGWSIGADFPGGFPGGATWTMAFRPTVSGLLDEIVAGLTYCGPGGACTIPGATNVAILSLYAQTPLSPTGGDILLETITVSGQMQLWVGQGNAFITAVSTAHPFLDASQFYWLRVSVPDPQTGYLVWGQSLNSQGQDSYLSVSGGPYAFFSSTEGAIQINGAPVPEPASAGLAAVALSALLWRTRRGWASSSSGLRTRRSMRTLARALRGAR